MIKLIELYDELGNLVDSFIWRLEDDYFLNSVMNFVDDIFTAKGWENKEFKIRLRPLPKEEMKNLPPREM